MRPLVGPRFVLRRRKEVTSTEIYRDGNTVHDRSADEVPRLPCVVGPSTAHQMAVDARIRRVDRQRYGPAYTKNDPGRLTTRKHLEVFNDIFDEGLEAGVLGRWHCVLSG